MAYTDYGNGTDTTSYFEYIFNSGSAIGDAYEITAEVFPVDGQEDPTVPIDSDSDSYTVTVYDEFTVPIESVTYCEDTNEFNITYSRDVEWAFYVLALGNQVVSGNNAQVVELTRIPPRDSGYREPDRGPARHKGGGAKGEHEEIWKKDPSGHGGPHYDVTFPDGNHINVYPPTAESPGWKIGGGDKTIENLPRSSKGKAKEIKKGMNRTSGGSWFSPSRLLTLAGGLGAGYLIYKGGKTLIGIALLPTPAAPVGGLLILTP